MRSKTPGGPRVATFADTEVIAAERTLAVMASHAAWPATGGVMIEGLGRGDLFSLRQAGAHLVAFVAGNFLMLCMVKADFKGRS